MRDSQTGTQQSEGIHERRDGRDVLRFERRLRHPVERVWEALTRPAELRTWLAEADLDLAEGGSVTLTWLNTDSEGNTAMARGRVSRLDPPRLIEFDTEPHGVLRWELAPDGDGTLLTFTATVSAPPEQRAMAMAGWHIHLDHLADALDGRPVDWSRWDTEHLPRWEAIHERYESRDS
jgi:uncharacterized protein YndB with AHSA1/START domain